MFLSIIIPTYNEASTIVAKKNHYLQENLIGQHYEIIISDGGNDETVAMFKKMELNCDFTRKRALRAK
jgi:glycosyltransferase involved in cell wall biosynthesis